MRLETERVYLRPWQEGDAACLYAYASDPKVGPAAGWPLHTSVENSLEIIQTVFSQPHTYAIVLKETKEPIGSIGIMQGTASRLCTSDREAELGYWLGVPYWGRGLVPEITRKVIAYCFEELHMETLWCGYFDGNEKSHRVQMKCGFTDHHTIPEVACTLLNEVHTEHVTCLRKGTWYQQTGCLKRDL